MATSRSAAAIAVFPGPGIFSWQLQAAHMEVNWTRETVLEVGRPPDFEAAMYRRRMATTTGQDPFDEAAASSSSALGRTSLFVTNATAQAAMEVDRTNISVAPAEGTALRLATDLPEFGVDVPVPNAALQTIAATGRTAVHGNFSVYIWDADILVRSPAGERTYKSGNWTEQVEPSGQAAATRYRHFQLLRLDVEGGRLELVSSERPVRHVVRELRIENEIAASFTNVAGTIATPMGRESLANEPFSIQGTGTMSVENDTAATGRLKSKIEFTEGDLGPTLNPPLHGPKADPGPAQSGPTIPAFRDPWMWTLLSLVPLAPLAYVIRRRVDPPNPDLLDVEWALLTHRRRRARRWARRLVVREPKNPDAVFLYGTALLEAGRFGELVGRVEPLASAIPVRLRRGIAFVLAVAAIRIGDRGRARRWGREAARDPELLQQLKTEPALASIPDLVLEDSTASAYA